MEIKAKLTNLRTAPKKARKVADLVRGKKAQEAVAILSFTINKSARPMLKLLNSALASAKNDFKLSENDLFVSKITVDEGPKLKRWHPMSRGRAYQILKRTSHVALILSDNNDVDKNKENKKEEVIEKKEKKVEAKPKSKKTTKNKTKKVKTKIKK
jgi:large subunit ribosomal protein L22